MALAPGTRLGVYEITAQIGEGGMGAVYRATDTSLSRQVAIKVLPDAFAADPDRLARFEREAKTLASLNDPHIAAIYAIEKSAGVTALVMELVEGDDLSQRIAKGAIPVDEALPVAKQIAEALEAAHEQGIIHRDLKPANIKVRADGTVKVLDFGLAKAMEPAAGSSPRMSMSPTITTPAMTQAGMILGTAAYMSPEQAKGRAVDKRCDVWAFGAVLFEMLTGSRAFPGDDVSEVLASVLAREPDLARLPATLSPALMTYIRRCLNKNPKQRIGDVQDVRLALEGAFDTVVPPPMAITPPPPPRNRLAWAVVASSIVGMVAFAGPTIRHLQEAPLNLAPETRVEIVTPATDDPASFALSPDGRQIVFVASGDGTSRLWLRSLASTTSQPLTGTEGALLPFWSPDGRSVGFFAGGALKRLDLGGGAPQILAPAVNGSGGTWNAEGVIVFAPTATGGLMRVSAKGSAATSVTTPATQQGGQYAPHFLPDGRRFLFYVRGAPEMAGVYLGTLDGSQTTRLTPSDSAGVPLSANWLLWLRGGTLVAQRMDLARMSLMGEQVAIAEGVAVDTLGRDAISVSATGLLAYRVGIARQRQLTWVDRSGKTLGTVGDPDGSVTNPRVFPDGRHVAVGRTVQGNQDLWLLEGARTSRLTFDPAVDIRPILSPDGARIVFRSMRTGAGDLYQKLSGSGAGEELLLTSDQLKTPTSWSPDGRFLMYINNDPQTSADIWFMPIAGDRKPVVFLKTPYYEVFGTFSPNGRWAAYQSNESGRLRALREETLRSVGRHFGLANNRL